MTESFVGREEAFKSTINVYGEGGGGDAKANPMDKFWGKSEGFQSIEVEAMLDGVKGTSEVNFDCTARG